MALPIKPRLLKRYRDIGLLLVRYRPLVTDDEADPAEAQRFAADLERLGPTFIKLGQLLSTRADLLPAPYLDALSRLQDQVEPFDFAEVERTFQAELGVRLSKAFVEVDPVPVAAASLAQVHKASLRDGRLVAIKVQRPDLHRRVAEDLEVLGDIAEFADAHSDAAHRLQLRAMFDEFKRSLVRELDFRNEGRNLVALAPLFFWGYGRNPEVIRVSFLGAGITDYLGMVAAPGFELAGAQRGHFALQLGS